MTDTAIDTTQFNQPDLLGRVKWFNNKSGYGFITVCEGEHKDKDIFAHFSSIVVNDSQYKYLVQGEYVQFDLVSSTEQNHKFKSLNIKGVRGYEIMCETMTNNVKESKPNLTP